MRTFELGADGRLFVTRTGKAGAPLTPPYLNPVSMKTIYRAWQSARRAALTPEQFDSMLGRRPYDLRHACLSAWLNAGFPAAQVARWAGHSIQVLLRVYAKCIDGQEGPPDSASKLHSGSRNGKSRRKFRWVFSADSRRWPEMADHDRT